MHIIITLEVAVKLCVLQGRILVKVKSKAIPVRGREGP
jgi:hypothetical protein